MAASARRMSDDLPYRRGESRNTFWPRRYGKSSLIRRALAAMSRRGAITVDVTVSSFSSYVAFLEGYARAIVAAETRWDRARAWLREAIRSSRAEVGADPGPDGSGSASLRV